MRPEPERHETSCPTVVENDASSSTDPSLSGVRLVLVGDWPPPPGGVAVHLQALHDAAVKAGADVRVLDIGKGRNSGPNLVPASSPTGFALSLFRACAWGDLIHLHTSGANPKSWLVTTGVGLAAGAAGLKSLVTFHSGHGPRYLNTPSRAFAARLALSRYNRVVCVNREISLALSRIGAASGRHVLAPAFGKEGLIPGEVPTQVETALQNNQRLVTAMLAPGRDYGEKELITAFSSISHQHPDTVLVLYGPGTDSSDTRKSLRRAGLDFVITLGSIERPGALALLRASTVFVRPTRVDGDAVSVREALAMGTRVVATRVGHRPDGVLLCEAGNPEELAKTLNRALIEGRPATVPGNLQDGIDTILNVYAQLVRGPAMRRVVA